MEDGFEVVEPARKLRKKIWQVPTSYHCSIIGVCFGRKELRRFKTKKHFAFGTSASDYQIHNMLSSIATAKSAQSRSLHKMLDTKFRLSIKRYAALANGDELQEQWQNDLACGDISGPYWAIMTHPATPKSLISKIYGDCHMLSFDTFSIKRQQLRLTNRHKDEVDKLSSQLERLSKETEAVREKHEAELILIKHDRSELVRQRIENERLRETNEKLMAKVSGVGLNDELAKLKTVLKSEQDNATRLKQRIEKLENELAAVEQSNESLTCFIGEQTEKMADLEKIRLEQEGEIASLEALMTETSTGLMDCENCSESDRCPMNNELLGKTVLYVGGQHKMIPHYKKIVESCGADFIHHDGGKENSKQQLPKLLSCADAVFCPIDCVSHDACLCVKRICKRYRTPFVMMRSSGLSSLARSLGEICQ